MSQIVNSIGLVLDIIGALLLFKFGLPAEISRSGSVGWTEIEPERTRMVDEARHYDRMGHLGLGLLIAGFLVQLVGNLLQLPAVAAVFANL